jgi:predicted TIM-barrel fold metal-dependent hydrolase
MSLSSSEVDRHLAELRAVAAACPLMDVHVHPFEVIGGSIRYAASSEHAGLWSSGDLCYLPPAAAAFDPQAAPAGPPGATGELQERMAAFFLRRLYMHTGPRCFRDQLSLGGISRALLLPVARPGEWVEAEMDFLATLFGRDPQFLLGYCLPDAVRNEEVEANLRRAVNRWGVQAVKVHPNLSRLDLAAAAGKVRLEAILVAAGRCGLPVVIHGGPSPVLADPAGRHYGRIENLDTVDFALTPFPVVIAHAGCFGLSLPEVEGEVLPRLRRLLARHDHLMLDLSALAIPVLARILRVIEPERLLFGSDALYDLPWKALIRLSIVLQQISGTCSEEKLMQIAGSNPAIIFGKEILRHDIAAAHQIPAVSGTLPG